MFFSDPGSFPEEISDIEAFYEPMVKVSMLYPKECFSNIDKLCMELRGERGEAAVIDDEQMNGVWRLPLGEIIINFFDNLRRITSGYVSFNQEFDGYREVDLVKVNIFLNDKIVHEFSILTTEKQARQKASAIVNKLQEVL